VDIVKDFAFIQNEVYHRNVATFYSIDRIGQIISYHSVDCVITAEDSTVIYDGPLVENELGKYECEFEIRDTITKGIGSVVWKYRETDTSTEKTCSKKLEILDGSVSGFYRYALIDDVRRAGVDKKKVIGGVEVFVISDEKISRALQMAEAMIDLATGQKFGVARDMEVFYGKNNKLKLLKMPVIAYEKILEEIYVNDTEPKNIGLDEMYGTKIPNDLLRTHSFVENEDNIRNPRVRYRYKFDRDKKYVFSGLFGYVELDFIRNKRWGVVPVAIQRVAVKIALLYLHNMTDGLSPLLYEQAVTKEKTEDQEVQKDSAMDAFIKLKAGRYVTGDPEIDSILWRYRRPMAMGSA